MGTKPFGLTNRMVQLVSSISAKVARIEVAFSYNSWSRLCKINRIRSIHSSLRIEANSLSLGQVKDVIDGKLVLGERREVQNAYAAYEELGHFDPFAIDELKRLHGVMTKYLIDESGMFRRGEGGVFSGDTCIFMAPPAKFVPQQMASLFHWLNASRETVHPLIASAVFHYEFVFIHPFSDGNGRMARLWHTALLSSWNPIFEYLPLESQIEKFQDAYYEAIATCHRQGSSTTFIEFMLEQIDQTLDEISTDIQEDDTEYPETIKKLLAAMEMNASYTRKELMDKIGLSSRANFSKNYLTPALEKHVIEMTIPDKPNSRNQKYRRTK